jgi:Membrane bound beta barrel domain (DUF5777)
MDFQFKFIKIVFILGLVTISSLAYSQDDELSKLVDDNTKNTAKEPVTATFKTTRLINLTTNEQVKKGELDFRIAHRFDDMAGPGKGLSNFFGFDNISDIRFSFDYGISNRWAIGFGRSKGSYSQSQVFDLNSKFKIKEQETNGFPLAISAHAGMTYTTMPSSGAPSSVTNFDKSAAHRIHYYAQLILAKKINPNISVILAPTVVHRNLVDMGDNNTTYAVAAGARVKISKRSAIIADYYQVLNVSSFQNGINLQMPFGLGWELETGGHVFHVLLSNNRGLVESQFLPANNDKISLGQIRLGFNISRVFTILHDKQ